MKLPLPSETVESQNDLKTIEIPLSDVELLKQQVKQMASQLTELTANMNEVLGRLSVLELQR